MIKKLMKTSLLVGALSVIVPINQAMAADACESVLCLYGKAVGSGGGGECKSAEKAFFKILKFKHGTIRWNKTFDARQAFLGQCSSADPKDISMIMSKFGKSLG